MIHFVIGTRAQLFKMAPIMLECQRRGLRWRWVYAAQHKETFEQTLSFFDLPPAHHTIINWDTEAKTIAKMLKWTTKMSTALTKSKQALDGLVGHRHVILTHGDTTTTVFGALMGKLTKTKVFHVESGLRSFNIFNPFPEEINRLITFRLADYFACPGDWALSNVEKYKGVKLNTKQNTQVDVLNYGLKNIHKAAIELPKEKYVVLSSHRFENIYKKDRFKLIIEAAEYAAKKYKVIIPQHPVTNLQITRQGYRQRLERNKNIVLMPRLEYENYLKTIKGSEFVMTDGGGNQEELYHLGKPTLVLRHKTERQEGLGENAVLSMLDMDIIKKFIRNYKQYERPPTDFSESPSVAIVDLIENYGLVT